MKLNTILHRNWTIFGELTEVNECVLPCDAGVLLSNDGNSSWIQQFIGKDASQLAIAWKNYLDASHDQGLCELVRLLSRLQPDGVFPWQDKYWLHLGLLGELPPDEISKGEHLFEAYRASRPGLYLPGPASHDDAESKLASVGLPMESTVCEFLCLFSGLREDTPLKSGYFIEVSSDWKDLQAKYVEATAESAGIPSHLLCKC